MNPATLTAASVTLRPDGGSPVDATLTYDPNTDRIVIDPAADLAPGQDYTAQISTAATSADGIAPRRAGHLELHDLAGPHDRPALPEHGDARSPTSTRSPTAAPARARSPTRWASRSRPRPRPRSAPSASTRAPARPARTSAASGPPAAPSSPQVTFAGESPDGWQTGAARRAADHQRRRDLRHLRQPQRLTTRSPRAASRPRSSPAPCAPWSAATASSATPPAPSRPPPSATATTWWTSWSPSADAAAAAAGADGQRDHPGRRRHRRGAQHVARPRPSRGAMDPRDAHRRRR